jgi:hypothetical protein
MRSLFIADEPMGFCAGCGLLCDAGDWIAIRQGQVCHAKTCSPRPTAVTTPAPEPMSLLFEDQGLRVIEEAKATIGASRIAFDGVSARPIDLPRLAGQIRSVFDLMKDGQYRNLATIAESVGGLETSAGARLRDLRKARNGSHVVESRYAGNGVHEYRLILNSEAQENGRRAA